VFGNDAEWIQAAIMSARDRFAAYPIDVFMVKYAPGMDYSGPVQAHAAQPAVQPRHASPPPSSHAHHLVGAGAGHAAAGAHSMDHQAWPTYAATAEPRAPSLKQQLDSLWETAYSAAKRFGIVEQAVFETIRRLRAEGKLSKSDVAAWINRRREQSGYTLLHQLAYHGNYDKMKQVCAAR
jgi:hypothetical protein